MIKDAFEKSENNREEQPYTIKNADCTIWTQNLI